MDEGGGKHTPSFRLDDFRRLLNSTEEGTAYEKGVIWENAAEYMLKRITGLRIGGKRLSVARQEIDLCCMNISTDEKLWDLGALILVECKNLGKKADVAVVRNIGEIMQVKGNKTTLLFSKGGVTQAAADEIRQLALMGGFVLCITKEDLLSVTKKEDFYDILVRKWSELEKTIENDLSLLG